MIPRPTTIRRAGARALALLLLAPLLLATAGPASADKLQDIRQRGHLIAGVRVDSPRFGGLSPQTGQITGFDVDIVNAIAAEILGSGAKPTVLVPVTSQNRITQLNTERVDLLAATLTISQPRMKEIAFSDVYLRVGQSLLVRKDSDITGYKDLAGRKVCTVVGSTPEQTIRRMVPTADVLTFNTYPECFLALQNRRTQAVTTGYMLLMDMYEADPANTKLVGGNFTFEAWCLGIKKGEAPLVQAVNAALLKIRDSGLYAKLYEKWIGTAVPDDLATWYGMSAAEAARLFAESTAK